MTVSRDPSRRMTFFLSTGQPHHLNTARVPLFLSAAVLARYRGRGDRSFPVAMTAGAPRAGDNGTYAALILSAPRTTTLDRPPRRVRRAVDPAHR